MNGCEFFFFMLGVALDLTASTAAIFLAVAKIMKGRDNHDK